MPLLEYGKHESATLVFSVEKSGLSAEVNNIRTSLMEQYLTSLQVTFKKVGGRYRGIAETSFMLTYSAPDLYFTTSVCVLVKHMFGQETLLAIDSTGLVTIYDCATNTTVPSGRWTEVEPHDALGSDAYTRIDDKYYRIIPDMEIRV